MKRADHPGDRFEERLPQVPPSVLQHARDMAPRIPDGPDPRIHIPLKHDGKEVGYAAYKRVGPQGRPVLATILGPNMPPRRSRILTESALKEALFKQASTPSEEQRAAAQERLSRVARGGGTPRAHAPDLKLKRPDQIDWQPPDVREAELAAYLDALKGPDGVPHGPPLSPSEREARRMGVELGGLSQDVQNSPARMLAEMHLGVAPESYESLMGNAEKAPLTPEQSQRQGGRVRALIDQLKELPEGDPTRNKLLASIQTEDRALAKQLIREHALGVGKATLRSPKLLGAAGLVGAGLTSNLWAPSVIRKALQWKNLSPEERDLPEEERDRLTSERSTAYRQLLEKGAPTSTDVRAKDVFKPLDTYLMAKQLEALDNFGTGGRVRDFLDPRESLARIVGARQMWHGTTTDAGKAILGTPEVPGTGLDPGYGGRPTGFTAKATHRQGLADVLHDVADSGAGGVPPALVSAVEDAGVALGAPPLNTKDLRAAAHVMQPKVPLPGLGATQPRLDTPHLDLDAQHFLPNAQGNVFVTTDRRGANSYAQSQNAHLTGQRIEEFVGALSGAHNAHQEKGVPGLLSREGARAAKELALGPMQILAGPQASKENPFLLGMALPEEEFHRRFTPDGDNVMQTDAWRLKDEHRVEPYAPGHEPAPGQAPHGMVIPAQDISAGNASLGQIWKARTKDFGRYARGLDLPEDQRLLGLNKRFLSGVGRGAVSLGVTGAAVNSAFGPLAKKLYRKYKQHGAEAAPEEVAPQPELQAPLEAQPKLAATKTRIFAGLRVRIDRPKGFVQKGKSPDGKAWERVYKCDYGYLAGTQGGDGDGLDVFLGPKEDGRAFLIWQKKADGSFDEYKLMLGFEDGYQAKAMYLAHVPSRFMGKIDEIPVGVLQGLTGREVDHSKVAAPAWVKRLRGTLSTGGPSAEILQGVKALPARRVQQLSPGGLEGPVDLMAGASFGGPEGLFARKTYSPWGGIHSGESTRTILAGKKRIADAAHAVGGETAEAIPRFLGSKVTGEAGGLRAQSDHTYFPGLKQPDHPLGPEGFHVQTPALRKDVADTERLLAPIPERVLDVPMRNPQELLDAGLPALGGNPGNLLRDSQGRPKLVDFLPEEVLHIPFQDTHRPPARGLSAENLVRKEVARPSFDTQKGRPLLG